MGSQQSTTGSAEPEDLSHLKVWTMEEIQAYNRENNAVLVIIHNKVFDVTKFMDEHPGGPDVLQEVRGQDGSEGFDDIGHSQDAIESMKDYLVGVISK